MKNNLIKSLFLFGIFAVLIACSTKKDRFINREFQALNTKYNVMYHGEIALEKGIEDLKSQYVENFWEVLPIERMAVPKENILPGATNTTNPNFERAEEKATKAIQKRSMNIDGREKNAQMDEAHLLLGKARYYDLRFVPALEAFNYVLYKYPLSDKIYEVKIWREKTNMRLENDAGAIINLKKLLRDIDFKDQVFADANATLAQAYLNVKEQDSALINLKIATEFTKSNEEKARYRFIIGQLQSNLGQKDSAFLAFQSVIDMNRKSPRRYVIQSHLQQAKQFDLETGDSIAFLKKFDELLEDRENRPFLDFLNHQMALFYDKQDNHKMATKYYNTSLKQRKEDQYLIASNYRNLAIINFDEAKYPIASKYYDSTLTFLDPQFREHRLITKKRENLVDVIKYEAIAQNNDSIIDLVKMSNEDRIAYFDKYIVELKENDRKAAELAEKKAELEAIRQSSAMQNNDGVSAFGSMNPPSSDFGPSSTESFYFYNPATVAFGKNEFRKKWGRRKAGDNWRWSGVSQTGDSRNSNQEEENDIVLQDPVSEETNIEDPRYTADFYITQLPTKKQEIDSLITDRNFAYYQLGTIYKEKFQEYNLAAAKLEQLLQNKPEERLVLPTMYNLFKIYEIIEPSKAVAMKQEIIREYPNSRYAQIISNESLSAEQLSQTPEAKYENLYKRYEINTNMALLSEIEEVIELYTGDEIVPKFELLRANSIGKLKGVNEYEKALNYVALNYPNSEEGKTAESIIEKNIPYLQKLKFNTEEATSWKLLFKIQDTTSTNNRIFLDKIKKFASERAGEGLSYSVDNYYMDELLLVIHGMSSESRAKDYSVFLKGSKEFKIMEPAIIVSSENYKVIQIQKNLELYIKGEPITTAETIENQNVNSGISKESEAKNVSSPESRNNRGTSSKKE